MRYTVITKKLKKTAPWFIVIAFILNSIGAGFTSREIKVRHNACLSPDTIFRQKINKSSAAGRKKLQKYAYLPRLFNTQKLEPAMIQLLSDIIFEENLRKIIPNGKAKKADIMPYAPRVEARLDEQLADGDYSDALLFFKPECFTSEMSGFYEFFHDVMQRITEEGAIIRNVKLMNAKFLQKKGTMKKHYGVINKIYTSIKNVPESILKELADSSLLQDLGIDKSRMFSCLEARENINEFFKEEVIGTENPEELISLFWDNNPRDFTKAAPGTYYKIFEIRGEKFLIFNGFHYSQLKHYHAAGTGVLAVRLKIPKNLISRFRDLVGSTDARKAKEGTLRNMFKGHFPAADSQYNGVHLSAGWVEAYFELLNFFPEINLKKTSFYKALKKKTGFTHPVLAKALNFLATNTLVIDSQGKAKPLFDATEEKPMDEVLDIIMKQIVNTKDYEPQVINLFYQLLTSAA